MLAHFHYQCHVHIKAYYFRYVTKAIKVSSYDAFNKCLAMMTSLHLNLTYTTTILYERGKKKPSNNNIQTKQIKNKVFLKAFSKGIMYIYNSVYFIISKTKFGKSGQTMRFFSVNQINFRRHS